MPDKFSCDNIRQEWEPEIKAAANESRAIVAFESAKPGLFIRGGPYPKYAGRTPKQKLADALRALADRLDPDSAW